MPAPLARPARPIDYEQPAPWYVRRRAKRLMIALTLLNLLIATNGLWRPPLVGAAGRRWAQYRQWRQHRQERQRQVTLQQPCLDFNPGPAVPAGAGTAGPALYEEDPARAAALQAGGGYSPVSFGPPLTIRPFGLPGPPWHLAVGADLPAAWQALQAALSDKMLPPALGPDALLFLHERRSPAGHRRLVTVGVYARQNCDDPQLGHYPSSDGPFQTGIYRELLACVSVPADDGTDFQTVLRLSMDVAQPDSCRGAIYQDKGAGGRWSAVPMGDVYRFFAGRADPADPSRFTLPYQLNGRDGVIDGRLGDDDRLTLTPAAGTLRGPPGSAGGWQSLSWGSPEVTPATTTAPGLPDN